MRIVLDRKVSLFCELTVWKALAGGLRFSNFYINRRILRRIDCCCITKWINDKNISGCKSNVRWREQPYSWSKCCGNIITAHSVEFKQILYSMKKKTVIKSISNLLESEVFDFDLRAKLVFSELNHADCEYIADLKGMSALAGDIQY